MALAGAWLLELAGAGWWCWLVVLVLVLVLVLGPEWTTPLAAASAWTVEEEEQRVGNGQCVLTVALLGRAAYRPRAIHLRWPGAKRGHRVLAMDPSIISRIARTAQPAAGLGRQEDGHATAAGAHRRAERPGPAWRHEVSMAGGRRRRRRRPLRWWWWGGHRQPVSCPRRPRPASVCVCVCACVCTRAPPAPAPPPAPPASTTSQHHQPAPPASTTTGAAAGRLHHRKWPWSATQTTVRAVDP
ncbi:hypothetical protein J3E74DRAFT_294873 [Bipolaris maydis]|nr:hypothetical protein J3E74DRAFT_294873 [Bipolaris maydis]